MSCRRHLSSSLPSCFFSSYSSLVSPLQPLGSGLLGRGDPRPFFLCRYGRRSGQPSSSSLARRACVHVLPFSLPYGVTIRVFVFFKFVYRDTLKLASPLSRGDGNGGRFVRSPCLPSWRGLRFYAVRQMLSLCSMYSNSPLSSRPQPLGRVGDDTPCEDTREDFGLFV